MSHAVQPFATAEEAWFWTMGALRARREGKRAYKAAVVRPCDPDDVIRSVDRLWRSGELDPAHLRVLRSYGERGTPPAHPDALELWNVAMAAIGAPLRQKGIVA